MLAGDRIVAALCWVAIPALILASNIELKPNPRSPSNPHVRVDSSRPETTYDGPLHQFESPIRMHSSMFKLRMGGGATDCFYYVLLAGYQLHLYVTTISSNDPMDVFDVFIYNGKGDHIKDIVFKTSATHEMNITDNDCYEICVYNPTAEKTVSYSSYQFLPASFEQALKDMAHENNLTIEAEKSVVNLELSIGRALNDIQNQPYASRDYHVVQSTNANVQWKAVLFICLMLLSFGGTTVFIRRLFDGQRSSV